MTSGIFDASPRMLPVFLLLDASGSMYGDKINTLNNAVKSMLHTFSKEGSTVAEIHVAVIVFGGCEAKVLLPLQNAVDAYEGFKPLEANGMTPMGDALINAKELIENKDAVPSRAYRPTVVLVSDGMPNDNWGEPLESFVGSGRSSKCQRMAMGIGEATVRGTDAFDVLAKFTGDVEFVFTAEAAEKINKFFQFVTMSTISRVQSTNPNMVTQVNPNVEYVVDDEDDDDIF